MWSASREQREQRHHFSVDTALSKFMRETCLRHLTCNAHDVLNLLSCSMSVVDDGNIYRLSGSTSELYIDPILPCFGDFDVMKTSRSKIVIPDHGTLLIGNLSHFMAAKVEVFSTCDSAQKGYVFLRRHSTYYCGKHHFDEADRADDENVSDVFLSNALDSRNDMVGILIKQYVGRNDITKTEGPAEVSVFELNDLMCWHMFTPADNSRIKSADIVSCIRCPFWPTQASGWISRDRLHGWPDELTIALVSSGGCDVVGATHHSSREDQFQRRFQWRLSFSRAEATLLGKWRPEQQIVYHMLRFFTKKWVFVDAANFAADGSKILNNYHIKTMLLWACEQQPASWWTPTELVSVCVKLLKILVGWLSNEHCPSYFVDGCNLFDVIPYCTDNELYTLRGMLESINVDAMCRWFGANYIGSICVRLARRTLLHGRFENCVIPMFCKQQCHWLTHSVSEMLSSPKWWSENFDCSSCSYYALTTILDLLNKTFFPTIQGDRYLAYSEVIRVYIAYSPRIRMTIREECKAAKCAIAEVEPRFIDHLVGMVYLNVSSYVVEICEQKFDVVIDALSDLLDLPKPDSSDCLRMLQNIAGKIGDRCVTLKSVEYHLCKAYFLRALKASSASSLVARLAYICLAALHYTVGDYQTSYSLLKYIFLEKQSDSETRGTICLPFIDTTSCAVHGLIRLFLFLRERLFLVCKMTGCGQHPEANSPYTAILLSKYLAAMCSSQLRDDRASYYCESYDTCFQTTKRPFISDIILHKLHSARRPCRQPTPRLGLHRKTFSLTNSVNLSIDRVEFSKQLVVSAVERLMKVQRSFDIRQYYVYYFDDLFEALVDYQHALYRSCLDRCTAFIRVLVNGDAAARRPSSTQILFACQPTDPPSMALLDDDLCCIIGLATILKPDMRFMNVTKAYGRTNIAQNILAFYLSFQCKLKLGLPAWPGDLLRLYVTVPDVWTYNLLSLPLIAFTYKKALKWNMKRSRQNFSD